MPAQLIGCQHVHMHSYICHTYFYTYINSCLTSVCSPNRFLELHSTKSLKKNIVLAALGRGSAQMPPPLERMLDSSADVGDSPCPQSDLAVYPEPQIDRAYRRSLMPCMQMHAHLQAAALRCYPGRKLLSPAAEKYHAYQTQRNEIQFSLRNATERSGAT